MQFTSGHDKSSRSTAARRLLGGFQDDGSPKNPRVYSVTHVSKNISKHISWQALIELLCEKEEAKLEEPHEKVSANSSSPNSWYCCGIYIYDIIQEGSNQFRP